MTSTHCLLSSLCFPNDQFCSCIEYPQYGDLFEVTCFAQNLTKFSSFTKISDQIFGHYNRWSINLTDNELTSIPNGIFSDFNRINKLEIHIFLDFSRNMISVIEDGAFLGVNHMRTSINLTDNRITTLPLAFRLLVDLTSLSLQGNPILTFDSTTVYSIAKTLNLFEIGYKALLSGNREFSVLNVTIMSIYDIPSDYGNLAFNPFLIFRNTVSDMLIAGTELKTLPCTLIDGPEMTYFYLQDATNISATHVFDCQPGTSLKVFDLEIIFSGLEEFPDILHFVPSLRALNLFHNKISNINEKFIPMQNNLEVINLSYNRLQTIPVAFHRFDHLKFLYIEYNHITFLPPEVLSIVSLCTTGNPWTHSGLYCNDRYNIPFMYIDNTTVLTPKPSSF